MEDPAPAAGETPPQPPTKSRWSLLAHPLLLILVTALITGIVVPRITRGWQNHDRTVQLKSDLVKQMGTSASAFLGAVEADAVSATGDRQLDLDRAYRAWEVSSAETDSQILAYFPHATTSVGSTWPESSCLGKLPGSTLTADESWRVYSCALASVHYLFSAPTSRYGKHGFWLDQLVAYLKVPRENADGVLLSPRTATGINPPYVSAMRVLLRNLRLEEGEISLLILHPHSKH